MTLIIMIHIEIWFVFFAKLGNVPTSLRSLKTKVDYLEVEELNIVPVVLNKLSGAVDN